MLGGGGAKGPPVISREDGMAVENPNVSGDHFVWAIGNLCRLHSLPFDPGLLRQRFPPPHGLQAILSATESLGLRYRNAGAISRETRSSNPSLLFSRAVQEEHSPRGVALLLGVDHGLAEILEPELQGPKSVDLSELKARYTDDVIAFSPSIPDGALDERASWSFGFSWVARELWRYRSTWVAVILGSLFLQVLSLLTPLLTQVVIDKVAVHQSPQTLWVIAVAMLIATSFGAVISWARQYLLLDLGNRVDARLATRLFAHILALPARYFERRSTGTLVARLQGVETIREFLAGAALLLLIEMPFALIFAAAMFWYSPALSWIAVLALSTLIALALLVAPELRRRLDRQFLLGARNQAFITEHVSGIETVKSLQMEPPLARRYENDISDYLSAGFSARSLASTYNVAAQWIEQMMSLLVLCAGAWLVMQNNGFTIGMLVAFQMFSGRMAQPMLRIAGLWQEFQQAAIAVRRIKDISDAPSEPYATAPSRTTLRDASIEFDAVSYRYMETLPLILDRVSIRIPSGSCVAVIGTSGSGKSTLARLLQGFVIPLEGAIRVGGRDLRTLAVNELRSQLGVVPQETVLFTGSVFENIVRANPAATFDEVVNACRYSEIHDFIESLPQGYNTQLGEHGAGLSGGQKQRIAIARALLKRPAILLFDEATSQLDALTSDLLGATISKLRGRVTVLFIAHQVPESLNPDRWIDLGNAGHTR